MYDSLRTVLVESGTHGKMGATYYMDGNIKVTLNAAKNELFHGYVGDYK